tara:strand:- start:5031 stop:6221 length:1191 start_codon:yes stop_codon:yes gene_type:complete
MTIESDEKTLTVGELLAMMNKLVEVDGEIADSEKERIAEIMDDYDEESHEITVGEAMSILTSLSAVDGDKDTEESIAIRELIEQHFDVSAEEDDASAESEDENEDETTGEAEESNEETEDVAESEETQKSDNEDIPDSTRTLNIDAEAHMWIHDLDLHYGNAQAIYNVSIPFERNAVTALIGPSGCGKSTLLRCLNRMNDLISICKIDGKIELEDDNIMARGADLVTIRRRVGMVFQKPNPFPKSIYDNVAYGVRLHYNPSRRELDRIVESALRRAALWDEVSDRLHELGTSLSGGQQQRLCIARTIAVEPEVILMDEPCSALDPIATAKIEELILELKKHFTVVIVTHSMSQAQRVSDYTAFMYLGRLIEFDKTKTIFGDPNMELTRRYISGRFG